MTISIIHDRALEYPTHEDYFSPDQSWPEYQLGHVSRNPNNVYAAVRRCLAEAGLDKDNFRKPTWNPLGEYISPGKRVFLLCNFVEQKYGGISDDAFFAKCTHGSVIRAVIDYVLIALHGEGSVVFGNAPLQSCEWSKVVEQTGASRVERFYTDVYKGKVRVRLVDLRQHVVKRGALGGLTVEYDSEPMNRCIEVDLGVQSLLDSFFQGSNLPKLRVLDYNPTRTESCHDKGKHIYLINREIIESDVVISVPKLKTHEKVGITCGIKGCVGTVAHKDCLAHHRYGPPSLGGDEYPDGLSAFRVISAIHDSVYTREPGLVTNVLHSLNYFSRKLIRRFTRALSGSWPGNDTCWRMAVDLARIVEYADKRGELRKNKQRIHLMVTDGIIGGEGDGPLSPRPVSSGYLCFSDNIVVGDYVNAIAMGFNPQKLPIIREAFNLPDYPLFKGDLSSLDVPMNGQVLPVESLRREFDRPFKPPKEWGGFFREQ